MDLKQIKETVAKFNEKPEKKDSTYVKLPAFKAKKGKQTIRLVPNKYNKALQFSEIKVYYGLAKFPISSPLNWGEKDPIDVFVKKLMNSGDTDQWKMGKKLEAKTRYYTTVIDRDSDTNEVLWYNFGVTLWRAFTALADDEEVGDYTDISEGRDIKLTTVGPETTGTDYNETNIAASMKITPLSDDKKVVESLLEDQPDLLGSFKKYSYDEMKEILKNYLNDGEEEEEETPEVVKDNTSSKSNESKFEAVFEEETEGEDDDDLPF